MRRGRSDERWRRGRRHRPRGPPRGRTCSSSRPAPRSAAGDGQGAALDAAAARAAATDEAATDEASPALTVRLDALDAAVALDQADLAAAARLARAAADGAAATGQPSVECDALFVLGAVARTTEGMEAGLPWYERAGAVAATAGLAQVHLRAQHEQALIGWTRRSMQPLHDVRALAVGYGALVTVAVVDLTLADMALSSYDRDGCLAAASACATASRRYGLATESVAHLWLAGAHALRGDRAAMQAAADDALAADPDDPRILGDLYGRVLPTLAFVEDELDRLPALLDTMIEHVRRAPATTSVFPGRILWALLHTIDDDDLGVAARAELAEATARMGLPFFEACGELIEAVAIGRQGDAEAATARFTPAYERLVADPIGAGAIHSYALIAARAALRDGWGDPVRCLREAEAFFGAGGYDRLARRCRIMLGEAGAPVPRRGRGDSEVPPTLRALGVTSREVDVLKLVDGGAHQQGDRGRALPVAEDRRAAPLEPVHPHGRRQPARPGRPGPHPPGGERSLIGGRAPDDPHRAKAHDRGMQTNIHEIADGVYRLSTCVPEVAPGGFTFNQYLIDGDEPMIFHTGGPAAVPAGVRGGGQGHRPHQLRVDQLRSRRVRRVRLHEPVAGGGAERDGGLQPARLHGVAQRPVRPAARADRGRERPRPRRSPDALHLHAARAPRLGGPGAVRRDDPHPVLRRPLHPGR